MNLKRLFAIACIIFILITGVSVSVSAEPTDAFTHVETQSGAQESVMSREMYHSTQVINATSLGLENSFTDLSDICSDKQGNVYLLIGGRSQIVLLNKEYAYVKTISILENGEEVNFDGAQGLYVDYNGDLYICDTNNSRIIVANAKGLVQKYMETPDSALLPEDFYYHPTGSPKMQKGIPISSAPVVITARWPMRQPESFWDSSGQTT